MVPERLTNRAQHTTRREAHTALADVLIRAGRTAPRFVRAVDGN